VYEKAESGKFKIKATLKEMLAKIRPDGVLLNELCLNYGAKPVSNDRIEEVNEAFKQDVINQCKDYECLALANSYKYNAKWVR
ncbi:hypothetical protein PFISCL1PPCAC_16876, partial [Pristionchus fissidentatus]